MLLKRGTNAIQRYLTGNTLNKHIYWASPMQLSVKALGLGHLSIQDPLKASQFLFVHEGHSPTQPVEYRPVSQPNNSAETILGLRQLKIK